MKISLLILGLVLHSARGFTLKTRTAGEDLPSLSSASAVVSQPHPTKNYTPLFSKLVSDHDHHSHSSNKNSALQKRSEPGSATPLAVADRDNLASNPSLGSLDLWVSMGNGLRSLSRTGNPIALAADGSINIVDTAKAYGMVRPINNFEYMLHLILIPSFC